MARQASASWRAWYTDARTFNSGDVSWADLPGTGVLGIVVYLELPYRRLVSGGDWYFLDGDGLPTSTETHEERGEWVDPPDVPDSVLKRGEAIPDGEWEEVRTEFMETNKWP